MIQFDWRIVFKWVETQPPTRSTKKSMGEKHFRQLDFEEQKKLKMGIQRNDGEPFRNRIDMKLKTLSLNHVN